MQISQLSGKRRYIMLPECPPDALEKNISFSLRPLLRKFKKRIQAAKVDYKNQAKRLCDALDTDKNGTVSKAEFFKYIEELQKSRKEGIIGVLAAGDDGSLILTRAQYMKRKKEEGDLFGESAPEHKVGTKSSNPSNLARIVSEGNKSKRGHGGGILNESDAKAIKVEIDDTSLNLKNVAEIKEETKETKSENKQEETQATLIDAKAEEPRELGKEEREDPEPSTARESMIPGSSDRTQLNGDEANAR
eukprot:1205185-Amorphochlora_amoeboformis.AAC.1